MNYQLFKKTLLAGLVSVAMSLTACGGGGGSSSGGDDPDPDPSTGKLTPKLSSSCLKMDEGTEVASGTCFDWSSNATNDYFVKLIKSVTEEFKIDAWRFDQAYQIPLANWKNITATLRYTAYNSAIKGFSVAEVWDGDGKNIEKHALKDGALESAFNFPLRYQLLKVIAGQEDRSDTATHQPATILAEEWGYGNFIRYSNHNVMPTMFVDNHDLVRLGNLLFRYGYANQSDVESQRATLDLYKKTHLLAFAFMGAYSGPITIYYGSEYGDYTKGFSTKLEPCGTGTRWCDDHVSRTQMKTSGFAPWQEKLRSNVKKIMDLRKANDALYNGQRFHIYSTTNIDSGENPREEANFYVDVKKSNRDGDPFVFVMSTSTKDRSLRLSSGLSQYLCQKAVGQNNCSLELVMDTSAPDVTPIAETKIGGRELIFNLQALSAQYYKVSTVPADIATINPGYNTDADYRSDIDSYDDTVNRFACFRGDNSEKCKLIIYQVMVEAAPNGPDDAGKGIGWGPSEHKGTLGGIEGSLDFIQGSGANALWITPVFKTSHSTDEAQMKTDGTGYFATSHWKGDAATIDDDFGGASALKSLINEVHNRHMYFILDGVLGHGKADMNADTTYFNVE